jgi:hypothetical protein
MKRRFKMLVIYFKRAGCMDIATFRTREEFEKWWPGQLVIQPNTKIIKEFEGSREECLAMINKPFVK